MWLALSFVAAFSSAARSALAETEAVAEATDFGRASYLRYCAACHGADGRGSGEFAGLLKVAPSDLTAIATRRDGSFPSGEIARLIDGRETPRAHGSSEMPIWGERLSEDDTKREDEISGEIALLVAYLSSIQTDAERGAELSTRRDEDRAKTVAKVGEEQFLRNCASCHGPAGRGDGYVGALLKDPPADLRTIAERNGGPFPSRRIAAIIDGRDHILAHGPRDMPVWGKHMRRLGGQGSDGVARGEIMLYVAYLRSIQDP